MTNFLLLRNLLPFLFNLEQKNQILLGMVAIVTGPVWFWGGLFKSKKIVFWEKTWRNVCLISFIPFFHIFHFHLQKPLKEKSQKKEMRTLQLLRNNVFRMTNRRWTMSNKRWRMMNKRWRMSNKRWKMKEVFVPSLCFLYICSWYWFLFFPFFFFLPFFFFCLLLY